MVKKWRILGNTKGKELANTKGKERFKYKILIKHHLSTLIKAVYVRFALCKERLHQYLIFEKSQDF